MYAPRQFALLGMVLALNVSVQGGVIDNLGTLGTTTNGFGINASGQVVGHSQVSSNLHGFLYSGTPGNGGSMSYLGDFGGSSSEAYAINDSGQIAGNSFTPTARHAFLYTGIPGSGGTMTDLGTLGGTNSRAYAINNAGQIAGYSQITGRLDYHAMLYTGTPGSGGAMYDLGTLGGTNSGSFAYAINSSTQIAGYSQTAGSGAFHAFLYTGTPGNGGAMSDLGTLGGSESRANGINDSGQVVGYAFDANEVSRAFLYSGQPGNGGAMVDLGTLGGPSSNATAINNSGQIIGNAQFSSSTTRHAFLYMGTPGVNGTMYDLDTLLDTKFPALGAFWQLTNAYGISDNGLITGFGTYNDGAGGLSDGTRAYILDANALIPEPVSLTLLTLVTSGLLKRTRSKA